MVEGSLGVVQAYFETLNWSECRDVSPLVAETAVWFNMPTGQTYRGPTGASAYWQGWLAALPDLWLELVSLQASGQTAAAEFVLRGTHRGRLQLPGGGVAPTRREIGLRCCEIYRVAENRFTQAHVYFDLNSLLFQLDLLTRPVGRDYPSQAQLPFYSN